MTTVLVFLPCLIFAFSWRDPLQAVSPLQVPFSEALPPLYEAVGLILSTPGFGGVEHRAGSVRHVGRLAVKVAVTAVLALIVTRQLPAPEQAPDQPAKVELGLGVAARVTDVPSG